MVGVISRGVDRRRTSAVFTGSPSLFMRYAALSSPRSASRSSWRSLPIAAQDTVHCLRRPMTMRRPMSIECQPASIVSRYRQSIISAMRRRSPPSSLMALASRFPRVEHNITLLFAKVQADPCGRNARVAGRVKQMGSGPRRRRPGLLPKPSCNRGVTMAVRDHNLPLMTRFRLRAG